MGYQVERMWDLYQSQLHRLNGRKFIYSTANDPDCNPWHPKILTLLVA